MKQTTLHPPASLKVCAGAAIALLTALSVSGSAVAGDALQESAIPSKLAAHSLLMDLDRVGNHLVAVGERGHILLSPDEGHSWQQVIAPVRVTLTASYFIDDKTGWAAGHDGVILNTQDGGRSWTKQLDGYRANDLMLSLARKRLEARQQALATATGDDRAALQSEIEDLKLQLEDAQSFKAEGPSRPFLGIWFKNGNEGIAVGAFGLILHTADGGQTWSAWYDHIDNPTGYHLNSIQQIGNRLFIAAEAGTLYRSDDWGNTWERLDSPYDGSFFGITGNPQGRVIAFGLRGHAFQSGDWGTTWAPIKTGIDTSLFNGTMLSDGSAVLVGAAGMTLHIDARGQVIGTTQDPARLPLTRAIESTNNGLLIASPAGIQAEAISQSK